MLDLIEWPENIFKNFAEILKNLILDLTDTKPNPSPGPNYHLVALNILTKLSIKSSNLDMLWAHYPISDFEKIIKKLLNGISKQDNQLYRELCLSCLCAIHTGENFNFTSHDSEFYDKAEDGCEKLFLKVFKDRRVKAVGVLLRFVEDLVQKRFRYEFVKGQTGVDEKQKQLRWFSYCMPHRRSERFVA